MPERVRARRRGEPTDVESAAPLRGDPRREQVLALQRAGGNQAVSRLLQRATVSSWELEIRREGEQKLGGDAVVYKRNTPQSAWEPVNDSTNSGYLERADAALGGLAVFNILAKWGVIGAGTIGRPFWRSHLIGAEFGGQKKYPTPADNVRYHPTALEQGAWQRCETGIKEQQSGTLTVTSTESNAAAQLAADIARLLGRADDQRLVGALTAALHSANFVPTTVSFAFTANPGGGQNVAGAWADQHAGLRVNEGIDRKKVFSALAELQNARLLSADAIAIAAEDKMPEEAPKIESLGGLKGFLADVFASSDGGRRKTVREGFAKWLKISAFDDGKFTTSMRNLPEVKRVPNPPQLVGVRSWLTTDDCAALV